MHFSGEQFVSLQIVPNSNVQMATVHFHGQNVMAGMTVVTGVMNITAVSITI